MLSAVPIRWRLAAASLVASAALLVALGAFVYLRVNGALRHSVDQSLRAQSAETTRSTREGAFLDADARESGIVVELLDRNGRVVRSDPASLGALIDTRTLEAAREHEVLKTISRGPGEANRWRVLATPHGGQVLVVARSLRPTEQTLHHVFRGLLIAGPVGLLIATLGAYALAAAALRPVESMRRRAGVISATTPGSRLPVPRSRDEIRDLAETLNGMLDRLEAALAHERRFVADASHELRTPLALLKAELELALRRPRSTAELREAVGSAAEETERLVQLAEALLTIESLDHPDLPLRREALDAADLAGAVARRFSEQAAASGRRIAVEAASGLRVGGDRLRLEQALGNLVDNSLRYGSGTVTIRARSTGAAVEIHVTDEGAGFAPEFAERAFERFSRDDDVRTRGGSGLGLAIVEAVAASHGGAVGIGSEGPGADVWLSLPVQERAS